MTIEILSIFSAVGIVVAFTMGFLFGIGYQKSEDMRAIKRMREQSNKALWEVREASLKAIDKAFESGKKCAEQERMMETDKFLDDLLAERNIKFGGF